MKYAVKIAYTDKDTWQSNEVGDVVELTDERYEEITTKLGKGALEPVTEVTDEVPKPRRGRKKEVE